MVRCNSKGGQGKWVHGHEKLGSRAIPKQSSCVLLSGEDKIASAYRNFIHACELSKRAHMPVLPRQISPRVRIVSGMRLLRESANGKSIDCNSLLGMAVLDSHFMRLTLSDFQFACGQIRDNLIFIIALPAPGIFVRVVPRGKIRLMKREAIPLL
mmetsp:Transcript_13113/g.32139  ORF Transcript_13113/g.32139 Transcript_13113/m.32139 type:complete len:155 (+) Transcript_13113:1114-1578(+)